ncbi:MAG TPA: hemolysin family protein [Planctomycetota bacterium]|nr:hemolysin family protein [Planctomycetota bacterium]
MNDDITLNILIIVLLVLTNAFFVAAEYALVRVRRTKIEKLIGDGVSAATVVRQALEQMDRYISATQVGVTAASLALGAIGEPFIAHRLKNAFNMALPEGHSPIWDHGVATAIALLAITIIHVIVGEIIPKNVSLQFPERVAMYLARPMRFCMFIFRPLIWFLNGSAGLFLRMFGLKVVESHALAFTEEELLMLLSESKKAGVVSEDEQKMLQRVFKFHDKNVREIMVPRPDMDGLNLRASEDEIRKAFEKGFSRLPVYDGTLDNIKGIVYVKDLLYTLQDPKLIKLVDLLREAVFVPETMPVSKLLHDFQKGRTHMAIVVDEFGDTAGLVTLEDVIEEIVGEIQDEYDYEAADVQRAPDGVLIFDGKTSMARFKEVFPNFEAPEGSYETVAGLVFQLAGRVPKEGDIIVNNELSFKITKRDGRRLRRITVRRARPSTRSTPEDSGEKKAAASEPSASGRESAPPAQAAVERQSEMNAEGIPAAADSARLKAVEK